MRLVDLQPRVIRNMMMAAEEPTRTALHRKIKAMPKNKRVRWARSGPTSQKEMYRCWREASIIDLLRELNYGINVAAVAECLEMPVYSVWRDMGILVDEGIVEKQKVNIQRGRRSVSSLYYLKKR